MNDRLAPLSIAIDGPAASGKGTLARRLADYYHLPHLDTGLTYRAVGYALLTHGLPLDNMSAAETAARRVSLSNLDREALSAQRSVSCPSQYLCALILRHWSYVGRT